MVTKIPPFHVQVLSRVNQQWTLHLFGIYLVQHCGGCNKFKERMEKMCEMLVNAKVS